MAKRPMQIPQGWADMDFGLVDVERLLVMIDFIISNEMQDGALLSHYDLINGNNAEVHRALPADLRWEMVRDGIRAVIQSILPLLVPGGKIGQVAPPHYHAHFAFRDADNAMLFKLKFS